MLAGRGEGAEEMDLGPGLVLSWVRSPLGNTPSQNTPNLS